MFILLALQPFTFSISLGESIGRGNYGTVHLARLGDDVVVAKSALAGVKNAADYLEVEADINRALHQTTRGDAHLAPYIGECFQGDTRYLVWRKVRGETLLDHCERGDGLEALAQALRIPSPAADGLQPLARELLRQLLLALACAHAAGVVHRDLKPENVLVDEESGTLRLIDFGSACSMAGWVVRRGYHASHGPCSTLYCAPEQLLVEEAPYAFDVYSAAALWLRCIVPGLRQGEEALFAMRVAIRDSTPAHAFAEWHRAASAADSLPAGWGDVFRGDDQSARLLELLAELLHLDASRRPSAAAALMGSYLNNQCSMEPLPLPPARPWSLEALQRIPQGEQVVGAEECELEDTEDHPLLLAVDLPARAVQGFALGRVPAGHTPLGSSHHLPARGPATAVGAARKGLAVTALPHSGPHGGLRLGDELLSVGSVDVRSWDEDRVLDLLHDWRGPTARLTVARPPLPHTAAQPGFGTPTLHSV